jgi:hypothetical protein
MCSCSYGNEAITVESTERSIRSDGREVVREQPPLAYRAALRALADCFASTAWLMGQHRMHLPKEHVGMRLRFADGSSARVFRETIVDRGATQDPCVLVVEFRLRAVWRVLALVSVRGSIHYVVLPGLRRDALLEQPQALADMSADADWWRLADAA